MSDAPVIVWFRQDLRLGDHRALTAAIDSGAPVLPVYLLDDISPGRWMAGAASRWWLHNSLEVLERSLQKIGGALVLRRGNARQAVPQLVVEVGARAHCMRFWPETEFH
jgi:deoxyribodipyrimidine photo-lyase